MPPSRRLDDRIRGLCSRALATRDPELLEPILSELMLNIHKRIGRLRILAAAAFSGKPSVPVERRKADEDS